jgi:hypothetical protein
MRLAGTELMPNSQSPHPPKLSLAERFRVVFATEQQRWGTLRALHKIGMPKVSELTGLHVAHVFHRSLIVDVELRDPPEGYDVRELTEADYAALPSIPEAEATTEFVASARRNGGFCVGAYHGDTLAAYVWRAFKDAPAEDGFRVRMGDKLRYGYKAYTMPEHRGLHLQSDISFKSERLCLARGCDQGVSYVEMHNYPSIAGDRRRGSIAAGWLAWFSKGGVRWCYTSPGARRFGFELYDAQRETL